MDVIQTPHILSFLSWSIYLLVTEQCVGHTTGIMDVTCVLFARFRLKTMHSLLSKFVRVFTALREARQSKGVRVNVDERHIVSKNHQLLSKL